MAQQAGWTASYHRSEPMRDPWGTVPGADHQQPGSDLGGLGPYRFVTRLGEGGQGTVYLAQAPDGRQVAVKVLHERIRGHAGERDDFMREVITAQRVPPYATARIVDVGVIGDRGYVVSEYVPGPSLERLVHESRPLDGDSLTRLAIATSAALAGIHSAGVVHRDFKPENVLIGPDGPRVIDFGVARALDHVTTSGGLKGTPAYMSPEQVSGRSVGPESDVFSWASTMFYGATGGPAFPGHTPYQIFSAILTHQPNLAVLPRGLVGPIAACLDKEPHNRPTAAQLMVAIAQ
ncbi:serine/threonine-protein kinase [Sphaerisporangium sp. NPDC088356]|uniref:serine/threonine-protein kinase n=1 Tax=Sphaerisporangium sp. NPDC088356 TaxID=3154871 RepID=UPI00342B5929